MAVLKCKSCGANLNFMPGNTVVECEYCGTVQTIPNSDDDRKLMLLNRATELRLDNEFDKACGIYETVVAEFPDEAEAYWGLVLCKYGIEYVSINAFKRVPTCHRTITMPIFNDKDYKAAYDRATVDSRLVYEKEAKVIDEIQKKIISIASKEEPYDVFICYKESDDATHTRTEDSTIAQDIYTELIRQGYKVFLARVTLNEVGVSDFEPYIFAALSSSRVMITVATKLDYINAVWVKNEWSRFISMMNNDKSKYLIPCIKNFLPEEMPAEFGGLQALNIGDVMFYKSLMNRINVAFGDRQTKVTETVVQQTQTVNTGGNPTVNSLLERAFMYLEDGNWQSADEYCEKVLDVDPKIAMAYLGKLMAELEVKQQSMLKNQAVPFNNNANFQKAVRFADDGLKSTLEDYIIFINERNENTRIEKIYSNALILMDTSKNEYEFIEAAEEFEKVKGFKDADNLAAECLEKAEIARKDEIYNEGIKLFKNANEQKVKKSSEYFDKIRGWRDTDEYIERLPERLENVKKDTIYSTARIRYEHSNFIPELEDSVNSLKELGSYNNADKLAEKIQNKIKDLKIKEQERQEKLAEKEKIERNHARAQTIKKVLLIVVALALVSVIVFSLVNKFVIIPKEKYAQANSYLENGEIEKACELYTELGKYKDSAKKRAEIVKTNYHLAQKGDYILFGQYEQDNVTDNGKEPIEWQVIAVEDNKIFVISKCILEYRPLNSEYNCEWSKSALCNWLDTKFLNAAFDTEQQKKILLTEYTSEYDTAFTLKNKIYLLSKQEVEQYNLNEEGVPTEFALASPPEYETVYKLWWTRTLEGFGDFYRIGNKYLWGYTGTDPLGVRPVMWIDISTSEK